MSERVYPFSNGTEYIAWDSAYCWKCGRGPYRNYDDPDAQQDGFCDIFDALADAYLDDGTISAEIAERMGDPWQQRCREFLAEWQPEPEKSEAERMRELGMPYLPGFDCGEAYNYYPNLDPETEL